MAHNENRSLERILESAIVVSWADLMRGTEAGLIHIEYGFAPDATLDYLKVWSSITRGHWLLACEYWMSASTCHSTGVRFENGYESEGLAHILESAMQHQNSFVLPPEPRPARIAPDFNAYGQRRRGGRGSGTPGIRPPRHTARGPGGRLKVPQHSLLGGR